MGRGGWKKVVQDLIAHGIREQFPNGETQIPSESKLIQTELFIDTNKTGYFFELRKKPILASEITENNQVIECMNEFYIIVTKFAISKELPIPDLWVNVPAGVSNIKGN